jgi:hypothetical protein
LKIIYKIFKEFAFKKEEKIENFLPPLTLRRNSFSRAEALLAQGLNDGDRIVFRPLHAWTDQNTTEQLFEAKKTARDRFGWEVDFPNFKMPFTKSVHTKVEKLGGIEAV